MTRKCAFSNCNFRVEKKFTKRTWHVSGKKKKSKYYLLRTTTRPCITNMLTEEQKNLSDSHMVGSILKTQSVEESRGANEKIIIKKRKDN